MQRPDRALPGLNASAAYGAGFALTDRERPDALNDAAERKLASGDLNGGRALLHQAIAIAPDRAILWVNLAAALHGLGLAAEEKAAFDRALSLEPRNLRALLHAAGWHEARGESRTAAAIYRRALESTPRGMQLSGPILAQLRHGEELVRANAVALENLIDASIGEVRANDPEPSLRRFDKCVGAFLKRHPVYRSQPSFLHYPELPEIEFHDPADLPWLAGVERRTDAIRAELLTALAEDAGLEPYITGVPPNDIWRELNDSRRWSVFYFWKAERTYPGNIARAPATVRALECVPKCDLAGSGPFALFSILAPRTRIPPHTGVHNARLIVHLPLIVPPDCGFRVGAQTREWRPGEALVFDDTIEHEAWNDSDLPRSVLIFDTWNPRLTLTERALVTALTRNVAEFYGELPAYL